MNSILNVKSIPKTIFSFVKNAINIYVESVKDEHNYLKEFDKHVIMNLVISS